MEKLATGPDEILRRGAERKKRSHKGPHLTVHATVYCPSHVSLPTHGLPLARTTPPAALSSAVVAAAATNILSTDAALDHRLVSGRHV